jgi:hypothetical protein
MEIGGKNSAKFLHIRRKQSDNLIRLASVRAEVQQKQLTSRQNGNDGGGDGRRRGR